MLSPFVKERFEGPGHVLCKHTTGGLQQIIGATVDQEKANIIHNEPEELIVEVLQFLVSTEKVDTHNMGCSEKAQAMRECIERAYKTISRADLLSSDHNFNGSMDDGTLQSLWSICPITSGLQPCHPPRRRPRPPPQCHCWWMWRDHIQPAH